MATGNAIDYVWKRYTDDNGGFWSVRVDSDWGGNGDSGLASYNAADPAFPSGNFYRKRKVALQDLVSGRKTTRVLGTVDADAGVRGATVTTVARGAGGTYTLTSQGTIPERKPKTGTIIHKSEPVTT